MRIHFILFAALVVLASCPAMAQTTTYSSPANKAITELNILSNNPTTATIVLQQQDGGTLSGSWNYQPYTVLGFPLASQMSITFEGETKSMIFITPGTMRTSIYSSRNFTEIAENRWIMGAGQGLANNIAVEKFGVNVPVVGFTITSDSQTTYTLTEQDLGTITKNLQSETVGGALAAIIDTIYNTFWDGYAMVSDLIYWLRFFFVDNLAMVVALFLAVPMAFAAKNSRGNPEKFLRQYFRSLKGFFEFILSLWRMLLESIGTIRGWFRL